MLRKIRKHFNTTSEILKYLLCKDTIMLVFLALSGYFKRFLPRHMSKLSKNLIELKIRNKCFICKYQLHTYAQKLVKETIRKFRKKYSQDYMHLLENPVFYVFFYENLERHYKESLHTCISSTFPKHLWNC